MCLAVPMKLKKRDGDIGTAELGGVERQINLMMLSDAEVGEYVIVHAGFAIQKLDEDEAQKTLDLLRQMSEDFSDNPDLDFANLTNNSNSDKNTD